MKFPSADAGALAPSGNSLAVTYPVVLGSRVGGVGRAAGGAGGVWAIIGPEQAARQIKQAKVGRRSIGGILLVSEMCFSYLRGELRYFLVF
jgi:hypothetical protein